MIDWLIIDTENAAEIRLNTNVLTEMQVLELIASLEGREHRAISTGMHIEYDSLEVRAQETTKQLTEIR